MCWCCRLDVSAGLTLVNYRAAFTSRSVRLFLVTILFHILLLLHPFNGLFSWTTWISRYQKGNTSLDLNEARDDEVLGCSGISWTRCKQSAPRSSQITTPTHHHSVCTGRMLFPTPNRQRQSILFIACTLLNRVLVACTLSLSWYRHGINDISLLGFLWMNCDIRDQADHGLGTFSSSGYISLGHLDLALWCGLLRAFIVHLLLDRDDFQMVGEKWLIELWFYVPLDDTKWVVSA